MIDLVFAALLTALGVVNGLRWLRVAQREHYLPWSVTRFAMRWRIIGIGLSVKGRTSKLAWTRRLRVLAAVTGVLYLVFIVAWRVVLPQWWIGELIEAATIWLTVDIALAITEPLEARMLKPFVEQATK